MDSVHIIYIPYLYKVRYLAPTLFASCASAKDQKAANRHSSTVKSSSLKYYVSTVHVAFSWASISDNQSIPDLTTKKGSSHL